MRFSMIFVYRTDLTVANLAWYWVLKRLFCDLASLAPALRQFFNVEGFDEERAIRLGKYLLVVLLRHHSAALPPFGSFKVVGNTLRGTAAKVQV
jgi:hypothetical protein